MIGERFARVRAGLVRLSSYLGLVNFLLLLGIALRWLHGELGVGVSLTLWWVGAYSVVGVLLVVAAWVDRRFVWPMESGVHASVNPLTTVTAFHAAVLLRGLRARGAANGEVRSAVVRALQRSGHREEFEMYERVLEGEGDWERLVVEAV